MTRSELIEKLAVKKNISNTVAEKIIIEIFKSMTDTLASGNGIEIRGFGSFKVRLSSAMVIFQFKGFAAKLICHPCRQANFPVWQQSSPS